MDVETGKSIIIFDGVCNFCDRSVRFVLNRDRQGRFLFASNQSRVGADLLRKFGVNPEVVSSVYLVAEGKIFAKSAAALEIARRMPFPWSLTRLFVLVPRFMRDWVYDFIARNRYRIFGKEETCRLATEEERGRFLS
jgi:predicted DCC family thiol-disulfide oxidoreductase YuxK